MTYRSGLVPVTGTTEASDPSPETMDSCQWFEQPCLLPLTAYLTKIKATQSGLRKFLVKEQHGNYTKTIARLFLTPEGKIEGPKEYLPDETTAALILQGSKLATWPIHLHATPSQLEPLIIASHASRDFIYECWNRTTDKISMVKIRHSFSSLVDGSSKKYFYTWTLHREPDGQLNWYRAEPDYLPFFKPRYLHSHCIMVHEGAKAARRAQHIAEGNERDHPWMQVLQKFEHWGAMPGATDFDSCDFDELRKLKPSQLVYFCDHDAPGVEAAGVFSKNIQLPLQIIRLEGENWSSGWDVGDNIPSSFFKDGRYIGLYPDELMQPGTWLTRSYLTPNSKPSIKPIITLAPQVEEEWSYIREAQLYVHKKYPYRHYTKDQFNDSVRAFSDTTNTSALLLAKVGAGVDRLIYNPALSPGRNSLPDQIIGFNTYLPTNLKPVEGNVGPWLSYLEKLFPVEKDRKHVLRWLATIVLTPRHLKYNLLLISEKQGTGKTTLGEILSRLVGRHNTGWPSESDLLSPFNTWLAHKRIIIISEIKNPKETSELYNKLATIIDPTVTVNRKFKEEYTVDNWANVILCSNNIRALKLEFSDRRWYVPRVTETLQDQRDWRAFYGWLQDDQGYSKIYHWFQTQQWDFIPEGDLPVETDLRQQILQETSSEGKQLAMHVLELVNKDIEEQTKEHNGHTLPVWMTTNALRELIIYHHHGGDERFQRIEAAHTLRRAAEQMLWKASKTPVFDEHRRAYVLSTSEDLVNLGLADLKKYYPAQRLTKELINTKYLNVKEPDPVVNKE